MKYGLSQNKESNWNQTVPNKLDAAQQSVAAEAAKRISYGSPSVVRGPAEPERYTLAYEVD